MLTKEVTANRLRPHPAMQQMAWSILTFAILFVFGCGFDAYRPEQNAANNSAPWKITELRADLGHDTMELADGSTYHNYFCAVVLVRNDESIHLLYENRLPENLALKVGDSYHINGLANENHSDHWNGYWIHTVQLQHADAQ